MGKQGQEAFLQAFVPNAALGGTRRFLPFFSVACTAQVAVNVFVARTALNHRTTANRAFQKSREKVAVGPFNGRTEFLSLSHLPAGCVEIFFRNYRREYAGCAAAGMPADDGLVSQQAMNQASVPLGTATV